MFLHLFPKIGRRIFSEFPSCRSCLHTTSVNLSCGGASRAPRLSSAASRAPAWPAVFSSDPSRLVPPSVCRRRAANLVCRLLLGPKTGIPDIPDIPDRPAVYLLLQYLL